MVPDGRAKSRPEATANGAGMLPSQPIVRAIRSRQRESPSVS
jgi:hypothetical protein